MSLTYELLIQYIKSSGWTLKEFEGRTNPPINDPFSPHASSSVWTKGYFKDIPAVEDRPRKTSSVTHSLCIFKPICDAHLIETINYIEMVEKDFDQNKANFLQECYIEKDPLLFRLGQISVENKETKKQRNK